MKFVTRANWGARPRDYINRGRLVAQTTCHWEGPTITIGGKTIWDHSKCASIVRGIQNFHMDTRGWSDIAYNFVECPHGYTFEGRGINVINGANGTNLGNQTSHAICCLAGEGNPFPMTEKVGFRECVEYIVAQANCKPGCQGHRDHKSTACPGDARYTWVHAGMPVDQPTTPQPVPKEAFLAGLTDEEQHEILEKVRNMPQMIVGRLQGSSGMDTVSLICGNTRLPLKTQEQADFYKYVLGQARALPHPPAAWDPLHVL